MRRIRSVWSRRLRWTLVASVLVFAAVQMFRLVRLRPEERQEPSESLIARARPPPPRQRTAVSMHQPNAFVPFAVGELNSEVAKVADRQRMASHSADEFCEPAAGARSVVFFYPDGEVGLLCNMLHELSTAVDVASMFPDRNVQVTLAISKETSSRIAEVVDWDMFLTMSASLSNLDLSFLGIETLHSVNVVEDWDLNRHHQCAVKAGRVVLDFRLSRLMRIHRPDFSPSLAFMIRPHPEQRALAEETVREYREAHPSDYLISVHRRNFVWCQPGVRAYVPFCERLGHNRWHRVNYYKDDCNVTMSDDLVKLVSKEALGMDELDRPFSIYLASDLHDLGGDATFYQWAEKVNRPILSMPHEENPEHKVMQNFTYYKRSSGAAYLKQIVKHHFDGFDMNWDMSMVRDMHAQTLADFSLGAPYSSCDRILAIWRSTLGRAGFSTYMEHPEVNNQAFRKALLKWKARLGDYTKQTFPDSCYRPFNNPEPKDLRTFADALKTFWKDQWPRVQGVKDGKVLVFDNTVAGVKAVHAPVGGGYEIHFDLF